jgi:hypothetical protein
MDKYQRSADLFAWLYYEHLAWVPEKRAWFKKERGQWVKLYTPPILEAAHVGSVFRWLAEEQTGEERKRLEKWGVSHGNLPTIKKILKLAKPLMGLRVADFHKVRWSFFTTR